jgi:hypothetical protein
MSCRLASRAVLGLALVLWPASPRPEAVQPREGIEEHVSTRVITRRVRIRPSFSVEPGACLALGAGDLDVRLRGKRVAAARVELDRERERTVHALVIDTSYSMADGLDAVRAAAAEYVRQLDLGRERALVVTFDDSVVLEHPATADHEELLRAIDGIRGGNATSLDDALDYTVQELALSRERAVIVLLTDGFDTSSLHERDDVTDRVAAHPDLTIFPIGFDLPALVSSGPSGLASIRHYLQNLAERTDGSYLVAPTASRVDAAYRRIREMLDSEAVLRVLDPDPTAKAGKLSVSSKEPGCRVEMLRSQETIEAPSLRALVRPWPELPYSFDVVSDPRYDLTAAYRAFREVDPLCAEGGSHAALEAAGIRGCVLDVTMDLGELYDPFSPESALGWTVGNEYLETRVRPFEIAVPALAALPRQPEDLAEQLGASALEASRREVERSSRRKPFERHARPFHDVTSVVAGRTFFDLREGVARALFALPDYRAWVLDELRAAAERDLDDLRARYRRQAPSASPEVVEAAMKESDEARAIAGRGANPSPADLTRLLGAWLGDLPAHELFRRWEALRLDALVAGSGDAAASAEFVARWAALRDLTFAPSYVRELTLLAPVRDENASEDRVGFYRLVLPRVNWIEPRLKDYEKHPGFADLPLDLLPEEPLAYEALRGMLDREPELARHLAREGYRVASVRYESRMLPRKRTPERAFRVCTASLVLDSGTRRAELALDLSRGHEADGSEMRLVAARASASDDAALVELVQRFDDARLSARLRGRF